MSTGVLPRPAAGPAPAAASAQIVRGFRPGWFGAVMGTAIVGVAAYQNPGGEASLAHAAHVVGVAFVLAAWAAAVLIAVPYLTRVVRHRDAARLSTIAAAILCACSTRQSRSPPRSTRVSSGSRRRGSSCATSGARALDPEPPVGAARVAVLVGAS
jgi:hypothetical protein